MGRGRRNDPWSRLRRHLSADGRRDLQRRDLQLALSFDRMLQEGHERAEILVALGLADADAEALACRIRESTRRARIQLEPGSRLAEVVANLSADGR